MVCPQCAEEHERKDCKAEELKCSNCCYAKNTLKLNLYTNHAVWDSSCKVYKRIETQIKNEINYSVQMKNHAVII